MAVAVAACSLSPGSRELSEAAVASLCRALDTLVAAASLPPAEAADAYSSTAATLDEVARDAPNASMKEKARVARVRALSSQARLASIHAGARREAKRREVEAALSQTARAIEDCG